MSSYIKFASIVFCFVSILFFTVRSKTSLIIPAALGFSVISDIFLLFTDFYIPGILSFVVVQYLYLIQLRGYHVFSLLKHVFARVLSSFIVLLFLFVLRVPIDLTLVVSVFYILFFAFNVITAFNILRKDRKNTPLIYMTSGLFLFFLCDINVGLFNLTSYILVDTSFITSFMQFSAIGMWLFYLPGQILIGISNFDK